MSAIKPPVRVLCVGGDLTPYGAPRVQLTLLERLERTLISSEIFYLRDEGGLNELGGSDLNIKFGVATNRRARNHVLPIVRKLTHLARHSDIVFSMLEGPPLYLSAIAARATGRPLISWFHNNWSAVLKYAKAWHGPASRFFIPRAERTICVSEGVREDLICSWPYLRDRTEVIPNPIRLDMVLRASLDQPPDWAAEIFLKPTILASGRLVWQKGFDLLLHAAAIASKNGADFNLLILGEGPQRQEFETLANQLGIQQRVFLPGYLSNPFSLYQNAAAFVLSSRFEGLPTVLIEALCLGLPIISFDCPSGPSEILAGGSFGRLVGSEDLSALASEIGQVVQGRTGLNYFRSKGPQRAQAYSGDSAAQRFERALLGCAHG
jgi:glycosyltransferase involved in cell wall biosynthesis